jgi:hypothetical protein
MLLCYNYFIEMKYYVVFISNQQYVEYVFWMFWLISSMLNYVNDVYMFWDYEYEIVFWNMIWWVLMPAAVGI